MNIDITAPGLTEKLDAQFAQNLDILEKVLHGKRPACDLEVPLFFLTMLHTWHRKAQEFEAQKNNACPKNTGPLSTPKWEH